MDVHFKSCDTIQCRCETQGYWYLVAVALSAAIGEFVLAWFFAKSGAATVDAFHTFIHGLWYFLALSASWHITSRNLSGREEEKVRARYGVINFFLLFGVLTLIVGVEAIPRLIHPEVVVIPYMLVSVLIGLLGNVISLIILKKIKRDHETYHWLTLDTLADLWLSLAILVSVPFVNTFPYLDPILTIVGACWIAKMGYSLFVSKTVKNL
ncbi:MAG: cation transporter [bacterium]|nr:cation transporter [bacterium]